MNFPRLGKFVEEDLEEIFELCDRVAIIFNGQFMAVLDSNDPRLCDIGLMMAGSKRIDTTLSSGTQSEKDSKEEPATP